VADPQKNLTRKQEEAIVGAALPDSILSSVLRSVCGSPRLSCPNPYWLATSLNHSYASEGAENHITLEAMKVNDDRTTGC